jgi:hypothetical protein
VIPVPWSEDAIVYLAAEFDVRTLSKERWTHEAHLVVGTYFVHTYGPDEALRRLRSGVCALNETHGTPNSATDGYHETITRFFVTAIGILLAEITPQNLADAVAAVLGSDLADSSAPLKHWSREALFDPTARFRWVEPDLAPL